MAKNVERRPAAFGDSLPDRIADFVHRWWWVVSGVSLPGFMVWAESLEISTASWVVIGIFSTLLFTCLLLGALVLLRRINPKREATHERDNFVDEVVSLGDLIGPFEPILAYKRFARCVIRGPGQLKFQSQVDTLFCSTLEGNLVERAEGADIRGSVLCHKVDFNQCYFDNIALIGTPDDMAKLRPNIAVESLADWKAKKWTS